MLRDEVQKVIEKKLGREVCLERPARAERGDFSTSVALKEKLDPQKIADSLCQEKIFEKVEMAGPGFVNFTLSSQCLHDELNKILKEKENYGTLRLAPFEGLSRPLRASRRQGKKIQVEFISANPTGPLTVGNAGRHAPFGDTLANILKKAGFKAEKAYYVNDHGMQIESLGHSVLKDGQAKYSGPYIDNLSQKIKEKDPRQAGQKAAKIIVDEYIRKTVKKMNVDFDEWIFESEICKKGYVDKILKLLKDKKLIFEKEGAVWFKSSQFGDERDRVLVKSDGQRTYLAGDIALHYYKFNKKKFDRVINVWGADHYGDIAGLQAGVEAIGHKGKLEIVLMQFVTLTKGGQKKRMSKRAGVYVTMDELLNEVGADAVRFFFLQKAPDTHFNFDMDLAKEQSGKNPVYYVQYAYARINSILKKAEFSIGKDFAELTHPSESILMRQLIKWPEVVEDIAEDYQVQRLPNYALELANSFHKFYESCRILNEKKELAQARLGLLKAVQYVLKDVLTVMGVSAPEKM